MKTKKATIPANAYVHEAGESNGGWPQIKVRFTGTIEEQEEGCRELLKAMNDAGHGLGFSEDKATGEAK